MNAWEKLPEAEYDVMQALWSLCPPATTHRLTEKLQGTRRLKTPALITLLGRLERRGFVRSEKESKERQYYPMVAEEEYRQFETALFVKRMHAGSLTSLMSAMDGSRALTDQELDELSEWLEAQRRRND